MITTQKELSENSQTKRIDFETSSSYQVGNMIAVVDSVFRQNGAETVNTILEKLMISDIENN